MRIQEKALDIVSFVAGPTIFLYGIFDFKGYVAGDPDLGTVAVGFHYTSVSLGFIITGSVLTLVGFLMVYWKNH